LAKEITVYRVLKSEGIPAEDRLRYREAIRQVDLASYRCRLRLVQEVDLRQRLPQIAVHTVLLASGRDKIVPSVAEARFMSQRIPNACRFEFREAGHALLLTPGISLADYVREKPRAGSEEAPS
jgi:pimeloyl-ACP methyl ester carboxylesterase